MEEATLKLQIESIEQQLKVLKAKIVKQKSLKTLFDLYGMFEGKMDLSQEEIKVNQGNTTNTFESKNTLVPLVYRASDKKFRAADIKKL